MKSRFNHHNHELNCGQFSSQNEPRSYERLPRPSSQSQTASGPRWNHANIQQHEPHSQANDKAHANANTSSNDDVEISFAKLNDFCLSCIEQLSSTKQDDSRDSVLKNLITEKLPRYIDLQVDLNESFQRYQAHHRWTQQMYHAVEPLLQQKTEAVNEQQHLNQLALQCVEQDMQLQYRIEQLRIRIASLEVAVSQHLLQMGSDIGLPEKIMVKLAKLIVQVMQR
jgi:hypothetical protein